jgi:hypothetical protein
VLGRRPHGREPPAGLAVAEEHVGQGVAELLATEPGHQHGRHLVGPGQQHRRAGVHHHHHGARVGGGDAPDQLVLAAGEGQGVAVEALALHLLGGADHDHGHVRLGGQGHRPHARLADDRLEGGQVALAQGPLVLPDVHGEPVGLRIVGHEVLHTGADPASLQPAHVGDPDPGREQRVLAEALEVAAAIGRSVQVDGGGEQRVDTPAAGLGGQQPAQPLHPPLVPALPAHPGRAVRHHHPAQPDRRLRPQRPEVGSVSSPASTPSVEGPVIASASSWIARWTWPWTLAGSPSWAKTAAKPSGGLLGPGRAGGRSAG